ncbi:response regulator [Caballeronia sp. LZ035]|uniref:response regulator transcription factor n=1 Tax=Caballeronia sp. LZ035 TaxID=3038568 RepID=UPI0028547FE4|nr:response regulator [Caballeronia sp. LZ035]MDR5763204.1 response regulator [Caballeronia sp. LZ035]
MSCTDTSLIGKPPTILLVDDERDTRAVWSMVLELEGMTVFAAEDGEDGFAQALAHMPDLIITDFMMPRLDGLEFCRRVRLDGRLGQTRLILWSAARQIDTHGMADLVVEKPVHIDSFLAHVQRLLRRH